MVSDRCCSLWFSLYGLVIFGGFMYPVTQAVDMELDVLICVLVMSGLSSLCCIGAGFAGRPQDNSVPNLWACTLCMASCSTIYIVPSLLCAWLLARSGHSVEAVVGMFFGMWPVIFLLSLCWGFTVSIARKFRLQRADDKIIKLLKSGTIRLLSCEWLTSSSDSYLEQNRGLARCQDLPEEAFLDPGKAARCYKMRGQVLVLSYGWLTKAHPDPFGERLRAVVRFLQTPDCAFQGLFWDFACLPQGPDRSEEEKARFSEGLKNISALYGTFNTTVLSLQTMPTAEAAAAYEGYNGTPYKTRGWCIMEYTVATFAAYFANSPDLLRVIDEEHEGPYNPPVEKPDMSRAKEDIENNAIFTCGKDDQEKVLTQLDMFRKMLLDYRVGEAYDTARMMGRIHEEQMRRIRES